MPRKTFKIRPVGIIDRRGIVTTIGDKNVLTRENLMVVGQTDEERYLKKMAGSRRFNSTTVSSTKPVTSLFRYYTKADVRKTFFFCDGSIYYIGSNGGTTQLESLFNKNAYPVFVEMRVSAQDVAYFMDGFNGMYSHDGNLENKFQRESAVSLNFVGATSFLDRMVGFEEDSEDLYLSKNLSPTDFTDSTDAVVITVGARRGSKIVQIAVLNETLYIFKSDSIWVLEGRTPSEFSVREVVTDRGLAARRSLKDAEGNLVGLMSDFEVWSFAGTRESMKCISYNAALGGDLSKDIPEIINRDRMAEVCAEYHNFMYRISFVETGEIQNNLEWCYNSVNKTDSFTRGNKVSCYVKYDRPPDKNELLTGRSDTGIVMYQYDSNLVYDKDGTSPTMSIRVKTKFIGMDSARNFRVRRIWLNTGVLGKNPLPVRTYIDGRNAPSDSITEQMDTYGESKSPITAMSIASQDAITSRQIPRHNNSKCQNIAFEIREETPDRDFQMSSFEIEIISKNLKRSRYAAV